MDTSPLHNDILKVVKEAYEEGWNDGQDDGAPGFLWERSEAKNDAIMMAALTEERNLIFNKCLCMKHGDGQPTARVCLACHKSDEIKSKKYDRLYKAIKERPHEKACAFHRGLPCDCWIGKSLEECIVKHPNAHGCGKAEGRS